MWCGHANALTYKILHNFSGGPDGEWPLGGLIADSDGNLFGVTLSGGGVGGCSAGTGCGTVFKISPKGEEAVLYAFAGGADGTRPEDSLVRDVIGSLYGVTQEGGSDCTPGDTSGCGTVFKISPSGAHTILHVFTGGSRDGKGPNGSLILDSVGNLYGTTGYGGGSGCINGYGCGTIYKLAPSEKETLLYRFQGTTDGAQPVAGLLRDSSGNLFGTTYYGGYFGGGFCSLYGCGVVFELPSGGSEQVLHAFKQSDGYFPDTGLIQDAKGNLYGATYSLQATLYRLSPAAKLTTLFKFNDDDANGTLPFGDVLIDTAGDLFVNNNHGGTHIQCDSGCGTLFELTADGTASPLHEFGDGAQDGYYPARNLLRRGKKIYGVTTYGGKYNMGTVWVLTL